MTKEYEQAKQDRNYLFETYGPAHVMAGGHVSLRSLEYLLENPTKHAAANEYADQIHCWFDTGYGDDTYGYFGDAKSDTKVIEIAKRYFCNIERIDA